MIDDCTAKFGPEKKDVTRSRKSIQDKIVGSIAKLHTCDMEDMSSNKNKNRKPFWCIESYMCKRYVIHCV